MKNIIKKYMKVWSRNVNKVILKFGYLVTILAREAFAHVVMEALNVGQEVVLY